MLLMDEREYSWLFDRTSNPYPQYPRAEYRRIENRNDDHYDRRAVKDYNEKCWKLDRQISSAIALFRRTFSSSVDDSLSRFWNKVNFEPRLQIIEAWEHMRKYYGSMSSAAIMNLENKMLLGDIVHTHKDAIS